MTNENNDPVYKISFTEEELHALHIAIADQLMAFSEIILSPDTESETLTMAKDIMLTFEKMLHNSDVENRGLLMSWHKTFATIKTEMESVIPPIEIEDNVIKVEFNQEKDGDDNGINEHNEEDQ